MTESVYGLAYAESVRTISAQASALDGLRTRAATILAATALVTSFLGGQSLGAPGGGLDGWSYIALGLLGAVFLLTAAILWPYGWQFSQDAAELVRIYDDADMDYASAQRDLAIHLDANLDSNEARIVRLAWAFKLSALFLTLEAIVWIIDLQS